MKTSFPWGRLLASTLLLATVVVIGLGVFAWSTLPLDHTTINMDGDIVSLSNLGGWQAMLLVAGLFVAALVAVIVVALLILLALASAAIGILVAIGTTLATLVVVASPLLLVLWLLWRALRPSRATIAAHGMMSVYRDPTADAMTTALIADDERLLREQLRARLGEVWPELEIVAEAKNGAEAVEQVAALHPDIVFLDIRMPGMNGIEAARAIAQLADRRRHRGRRPMPAPTARPMPGSNPGTAARSSSSPPTTSTPSRPSSRVSSTTC